MKPKHAELEGLKGGFYVVVLCDLYMFLGLNLLIPYFVAGHPKTGEIRFPSDKVAVEVGNHYCQVFGLGSKTRLVAITIYVSDLDLLNGGVQQN